MSIFLIYYVVALLLMCVMIYRYRRYALAVLMLLISFVGVFDFFIPRGTQYMNIVTTLFSTFLLFQWSKGELVRRYRSAITTFVVFSIYFVVVNLLYHHNNILFVFSQYSKFYVPFVLMFLFLQTAWREKGTLCRYNTLILEILLVQIFLSVLKWFLVGGAWEGMVGSFGGLRGGGAGTGVVVAALLWITVNSNMQIMRWYQWLFLIGVLFIGIATGKRAIVILFPIYFIILAVFVCRRKVSWKQFLIIPVALVFLYLGVRLTPSLNPEKKVWGSFDIEYALSYAEDYVGGTPETQHAELYIQTQTKYEGRLGSVLFMWDILTDVDNYGSATLFGKGVQEAYSSAEDREAYNKFGQKYGLNHRGDLTGIYMMYIAIGVIGIFLFLLYYWNFCRVVKYKRLCLVLFLIIMFDYICYNSTMVRNPFVSMLVTFTIVYSNVKYTENGRFVGGGHPFFQEKKYNPFTLN